MPKHGESEERRNLDGTSDERSDRGERRDGPRPGGPRGSAGGDAGRPARSGHSDRPNLGRRSADLEIGGRTPTRADDTEGALPVPNEAFPSRAAEEYLDGFFAAGEDDAVDELLGHFPDRTGPAVPRRHNFVPPVDHRRAALWEECQAEASQLLEVRAVRVRLRAYRQALGDTEVAIRLPLAALLMATQEAFANRRPATVEAALTALVGDLETDDSSDDDGNVVVGTVMYRLLDSVGQAKERGVVEPSLHMDAWLEHDKYRTMADAMAVAVRGAVGSTYTGGSSHEFSALNFEIPIVGPSGRSLRQIEAELDDWPGLAGIKDVVAQFAAEQRVRVARRRAGLKESASSWHMMFTGNPGTGKTTVARLIAEVLDASGALPGAHLVEADRSMLVGEWLGTSALKTRKVVDAALGGVLFVDEAYSLAGTAGEGRQTDRFALEALATLVKCMEDERANLAVILAGYPEEMRQLLATNAGLRSRIGMVVDFPDYSDGDLLDILGLMARSADYVLAPDAVAALRSGIPAARAEAGFGNGRWVRAVFEAAVRVHAMRITEAAGADGELDVEELQTLRLTDIAAGVWQARG